MKNDVVLFDELHVSILIPTGSTVKEEVQLRKFCRSLGPAISRMIKFKLLVARIMTKIEVKVTK